MASISRVTFVRASDTNAMYGATAVTERSGIESVLSAARDASTEREEFPPSVSLGPPSSSAPALVSAHRHES